MTDRVSCTVVDGVADVRLSRPDKMNALDPAMFAALAETGEQLKSTAGLRAVVLSGEGRAFCAGLDFTSFAAMADPSAGGGDVGSIGRMTDGGMTHLAQQVSWVWQELPVPVIAALHGAALGGGAQIALGADIRLGAPSLRFGILETNWGLIPDMTGTFRLAQLVRPDIAMELATTGRIVTGEEAHRLGLITFLTERPLEDALTLAGQIAQRSPHAIRGVKELLRGAYGGNDAATQFAEERRVIFSLIGSANQREAVKATFEKRPATFADV